MHLNTEIHLELGDTMENCQKYYCGKRGSIWKYGFVLFGGFALGYFAKGYVQDNYSTIRQSIDSVLDKFDPKNCRVENLEQTIEALDVGEKNEKPEAEENTQQFS